MKLQTVGPPEGGSLAVVYACPECGYEMAMLTNPFETQLVQSLGVRIGPDKTASSAAGLSAGTHEGTASASGGRCPFPAMMSGVEGAVDGAAMGRASAAGEAGHDQAAEPIAVRWTSAAEARLANIPSFVRPMARTGIEQFARERGTLEIDEKTLDAARDFFGM